MPWGSCPCPGVEMRGSPPLAPPLCVCGEIYLTLPYLTADSTVFTWGKGESGCLGHGEDLSNQLLPKKVEAWAPERLGV